MGDRTSVRLTVLTSQLAAAQKHFNTEANESDTHTEFTELTFYDVNYGNLPFLADLLKAGVAYDSYWSSGGDFGPGTESLRFNDKGEPYTSTLYDEGINPNLSDLMARIDKPDELRAFLLQHQEDVADRPWDNQEEYGKIYLATQLINPT